MTKTARIRGRRLQAIRARIMRRANGLCENCLEGGFTVPGSEVDHRVPLFKGGKEEDSNRWLLCVKCHAEKTRDDLAQRPKGCDRNGWPVDPNHPWNKEKTRV